MKKMVKVSAYVSAIGFIVLIILRFVLSNINTENLVLMNLYTNLNDFVYVPFLVLTFISSIYVTIETIKMKFQKPLKYFYLIIPSLLYMLIYIIVVCILLLKGKLWKYGSVSY